MPAMKIAMSVLACALALLAGCGVADQYATFVPKILRQPSTEPPAPEPEPDVKAMVRGRRYPVYRPSNRRGGFATPPGCGARI